MGRNKISIEKITNERLRQVTLYKRKKGLVKKAMELSVLCDVKVLLCIVDKNDKVLMYSSDPDVQSFTENYVAPKSVNRDFISNFDYQDLFIDNKIKFSEFTSVTNLRENSSVFDPEMLEKRSSINSKYTSSVINKFNRKLQVKDVVEDTAKSIYDQNYTNTVMSEDCDSNKTVLSANSIKEDDELGSDLPEALDNFESLKSNSKIAKKSVSRKTRKKKSQIEMDCDEKKYYKNTGPEIFSTKNIFRDDSNNGFNKPNFYSKQKNKDNYVKKIKNISKKIFKQNFLEKPSPNELLGGKKNRAKPLDLFGTCISYFENPLNRPPSQQQLVDVNNNYDNPIDTFDNPYQDLLVNDKQIYEIEENPQSYFMESPNLYKNEIMKSPNVFDIYQNNLDNVLQEQKFSNNSPNYIQNLLKNNSKEENKNEYPL